MFPWDKQTDNLKNKKSNYHYQRQRQRKASDGEEKSPHDNSFLPEINQSNRNNDDSMYDKGFDRHSK